MQCPNCGGTGVELLDYDWFCCGNYLSTGECCSAIHGGANLVMVPVESECEACGGSGVI